MPTSDRLIKAVQTATRKLASSGNVDALLKDVLSICMRAVGANGGTVYLHDPDGHRLVFHHVLPESVQGKLPFKDISDDFGIAGQAFQARQTVRQEFPNRNEEDRNAFESATGVDIRDVIAAPLMIENEAPIGVVQLLNKKEGRFTDTDLAVLETVAAVSAMAILNARLSEETARASTLLGMGKVGHDIQNLAASLYAGLNYSDLVVAGLKTEHGQTKGVMDLQEMLLDLHSSVDRIVGYSRLLSDLSAGKALSPVRKPLSLAHTIRAAAEYFEADAEQKGIAISYNLAEKAPLFAQDELYMNRIIQNLVGNAIKAVQEGPPAGERAVHIRYGIEPQGHVIEVKDTGPGMPAEVVQRILNGNAKSHWEKASGAGWGTKIVLELAATHGGIVEIDSKVGHGSTFRVVFPLGAQGHLN
jgi:signal transduction histidine kinase